VLAGAWRGSNNLGNLVDLIVHDDGHFDAIITTPHKPFAERAKSAGKASSLCTTPIRRTDK
jgi:hypothetical protein